MTSRREVFVSAPPPEKKSEISTAEGLAGLFLLLLCLLLLGTFVYSGLGLILGFFNWKVALGVLILAFASGLFAGMCYLFRPENT